jgi:hypothetical protein
MLPAACPVLPVPPSFRLHGLWRIHSKLEQHRILKQSTAVRALETEAVSEGIILLGRYTISWDWLNMKIGAVGFFETSPTVYQSTARDVFSNSKLQPQDATFLEFIYVYRLSTCFRRFLLPSSGAQNCTYSVRYFQTNTAARCYRGWDGTQ